MQYPAKWRSSRADYCEAMYCRAVRHNRHALAVYWARQELAALYPDGRRWSR